MLDRLARLSSFARKHLGRTGPIRSARPDLEPGGMRELRDPDGPDDDEK